MTAALDTQRQWERRKGTRAPDGWHWHKWEPCTEAQARRVSGLRSWQVQLLTTTNRCPVADSPYRPGDPPPGGYLNWHAWAEVQSKAGLEQAQCSRCGLWRFPQELDDGACLKCAPGVGGTQK